MASKREQVLATLAAGLQAAVAPADFARNPSKTVTPRTGGLVIMRDGDPGDPEMTLGILAYSYHHRVALEVAFIGATEAVRREGLDALLVRIGAFCVVDRSLGGLTEWLEPEAPSFDDVNINGADPVAWADVGILADYTTSNPLT